MPTSLNTKGKVALYHTLEDEALALACDTEVQLVKQEGFRDNIIRRRVVQNALKRVLNDDKLAEQVYQIIDKHKEDY